jgi:hypothetical protein
VIGIGGFALAYVVIFVFVLPTKIIPSQRQQAGPNAAAVPQPIDTAVPAISQQQPQTPSEPPPVSERVIETPPERPPIPTPDLVGMSLPDARGVLNNLRLKTAVARDTSSFQPPNTVLRQDPEADSLVATDGTITLTVSYFPPDSTSDTMRVQRKDTLSRIRPASDSLHPPGTLHPE